MFEIPKTKQTKAKSAKKGGIGRALLKTGANVLDDYFLANPKTTVPAMALKTAGLSASSVLDKILKKWDAWKERPARVSVSGATLPEEPMTAPVAYSAFMKDLTNESITEVHDPAYGQGIIMVFNQMADVVKFDGTTDNPWADSGPWKHSGSVTYEKELNPRWFGGRVMTMASLYARFRFTKLILTYVPTVATTQPGAMAIGYKADVNAAGTPDYPGVSQMDGAVSFTAWAPGTMEIPCLAPDLFYTRPQTASPTWADTRICNQGCINGAWDAIRAAATTGTLWVMGEVQMFGRVIPQGYTLDSSLTPIVDAIARQIGTYGEGLPFAVSEMDQWKADLTVRRCEGKACLTFTVLHVGRELGPDEDDREKIKDWEDENDVPSTKSTLPIRRTGV